MIELQAQLQRARQELSTLEQSRRQACDVKAAQRITELQKRQMELRTLKMQAQQVERLNQRIKEFIGDNLRDLKNELDTIGSMRQQYIRKREDAVNSQFEPVKFKLFKVLSTTGEVRETCEPMVDSVPYANLSTGEKFKASSDILKALQKRYGVQMPLMVDNAESLTPNSLVQLTNQMFLFSVDDGDLKIEVVE